MWPYTITYSYIITAYSIFMIIYNSYQINDRECNKKGVLIINSELEVTKTPKTQEYFNILKILSNVEL